VRAREGEKNQKDERDLAQSFSLLALNSQKYYVKDDVMECTCSGSNELIALKRSTE
jgi:hypothetical protein